MGRASRRKREYREHFPDGAGTDLIERLRRQGLIDWRYDVREGAVLGIGLGILLSGIAALRLLVATAARGQAGEEVRVWALATAFYLAAGLIGGIIFGLFRPLRDRYWGQFLTAYLILFLVYGGGTVAFLGLIENNGASLRTLLPVWAMICLALAPIYVRITRNWDQPKHPPT